MEAAAALSIGASVSFAVLQVAVMCGAVLAGQAAAVGAMALLVKFQSRERAEGESLFHGDIFRLSPAESQAAIPAPTR